MFYANSNHLSKLHEKRIANEIFAVFTECGRLLLQDGTLIINMYLISFKFDSSDFKII